MKTYKFEIEVTIDENEIANKYPNFRFNYMNNEAGLREFAKSLATPYSEENSMENFGFKISKLKKAK